MPCNVADAKAAGSSKPKKLLSKHKGTELTGVAGWVAKKYRSVRHAARGIFNRTMKVGLLSWAHMPHPCMYMHVRIAGVPGVDEARQWPLLVFNFLQTPVRTLKLILGGVPHVTC